jgi:hypothetical protein
MKLKQLYGVQWVVNLLHSKTGLVTFSLPEFNPKKQMFSSWKFHLDDRFESQKAHMI